MRKHKHNFNTLSFSNGRIRKMKCKCGQETTIELTKSEQRQYKKEFMAVVSPKRNDNVHLVYHDFQRKFKIFEDYKFKGYDFIEKVRKWAKKYPDDVFIDSCDDSAFAGSILVSILHKKRNKEFFFGTTVLYIPQCTGENPIEFFLYPDAMRDFIKTLKLITKIQKSCKKREY